MYCNHQPEIGLRQRQVHRPARVRRSLIQSLREKATVLKPTDSQTLIRSRLPIVKPIVKPRSVSRWKTKNSITMATTSNTGCIGITSAQFRRGDAGRVQHGERDEERGTVDQVGPALRLRQAHRPARARQSLFQNLKGKAMVRRMT